MALLGWSPEGENEIFSLDELVKEFDYHRIGKAPAVFDMTKLRWMNGEYMKKLDFEDFYNRALPYMKKAISRDVDFRKLASLIQTRIETFLDIEDQVSFIEQVPDYDLEMYKNKKNKTNLENSLKIIEGVLEVLKDQDDFSNDALYAVLSAYVEKENVKVGHVMWPVRIALSGRKMTPGGATELMQILGKQESLARLGAAADRLRG